MKTQHPLLQATGGSECGYNKQAAQTQLPTARSPSSCQALPPSPSLAPLPPLQTFPFLPECLVFVHLALVDIPLLLSSAPPGALAGLTQGRSCSLTPAPSCGPGGHTPHPPLGCFVLQDPLGPPPTYTLELRLEISQQPTKDKDLKSFQEGKTKNSRLKKKKKISQNDSEDCNTRSQRTGVRTPREGGLPPGILSHQCEVEKHPQTDMGSETLFPLFPLRNH